MQRAVSTTSIALLASLPFVGSACVPQDKYDHLLTAKRTIEEQLVRAEDERDTYKGNLNTALAELDRARGSYSSLQGEYDGLKDMVDSVAVENDEYLSRISMLEMGPLPADMAMALEALASAYPEMVSFDAQTGMLRLASDFSFDLGSAELTENARATIAALAQVLDSDTALGFEARVVGHTDNVPIRQAHTRQMHPTNVHLSVHRSISVRDELVQNGVQPTRIQVAGYGEWRPSVENHRGGAAGNRRVEIFLVPLPQQPLASPTESIEVEETIEEPMK